MLEIRSTLVAAGTAAIVLVACQRGAVVPVPGNAQQANPQTSQSIAGDNSEASGNGPAIRVRAVTEGQGDNFIPFDPAQVGLADATGRDITENLFAGLTRLNGESNAIEPELAQGWVVSSDGLRWTFELRDDIVWAAFDPAVGAISALRPVTASDAVFAIWRACHPGTDAPYASLLFIIVGCEQINASDPSLISEEMLANTIRAIALSPTRLSIELDERRSHFLVLTSLPVMRPLAPEAFALEQAEWRDDGLIASSGAWVVAPDITDNRITLLANPYWPDEREGNIDEWEINFAGNRQNALNAWQAGQADFAHLPADQRAAASFIKVEERVTFLAFAADQSPLEDARVRRALSAAIDRQRVVDEVLGGNGLPITDFTPPGTVGSPLDTQPDAFNPDFAREQLAYAGYPGCRVFPRLTVMTDRSAQSVALAQAYITMWQTTLNCNNTRFELLQRDLREVLGFVSTPLAADFQTRPHIYLLTWQADYPDANNWLGDVLHCEHGWLQLGRPCESVDDIIERAARELNPDVRALLYAEIESVLFGEDGLQPIAPIYISIFPIAIGPALSATSNGSPTIAIGPARYALWRFTKSAAQ